MYNTKLEEKIDAAAKQWRNEEKTEDVHPALARALVSAGRRRRVCYLLKDNMAFGIWKDSLIVRMDKEQEEKSLKDRNVKPFDITGRPVAGWVMVQEAGWKSPAGLTKWMGIGKAFALSLPEKKGKAKAKKKTKTLREYNVLY